MLNKLERLLLQLTVFLIPSNLAYHWFHDGAYIHGRLIDYLLPKLYLSDITILGIIVIIVFRYIRYNGYINYIYLCISGKHHLTVKPSNRLTLKFPSLFLFLFFTYLIIRSLWTETPVSSLWYALKMVEFGFFGWYLVKTYSLAEFLHLTRLPLLFSLLFQSLLGIYQFSTQHSLLGYYFLGEVDLHSLGIARESYLGHLLIPPYGTTSHPNILAGFLLVSSLILFLPYLQPLPRFTYHQTIPSLLILGLISLVFSLTKSLEVTVCLILTVCLVLINNIFSINIHRVLYMIIVVSSILLSPLIITKLYHLPIADDNPSILNRYELNFTAKNLVFSHFLTGIGPNQFTVALSQQGLQVGQKTYIFQPVHNIYLLTISEIGLLGILLLFLSLFSLLPHLSLKSTPLLPLLCLVIVGSFDHYPMTLQTGQLLLTLCLVLPLMKPSPNA